MKTIGIFEAKTKLSEVCDEVARSGRSVVVTRRGKPLVRIDPIRADGLSVWEDREDYIAREGRWKEDFDVPSRDPQLPGSPLDE
jgi:prevent-host-death family protein